MPRLKISVQAVAYPRRCASSAALPEAVLGLQLVDLGTQRIIPDRHLENSGVAGNDARPALPVLETYDPARRLNGSARRQQHALFLQRRAAMMPTGPLPHGLLATTDNGNVASRME